MRRKECVAMILAGGQGSRLGLLTKKIAKPAVPFGGKYRIIDFTLSNCQNSGFDTIGILTQYKPLALHSYIGIGSTWDLDSKNGGVFILPPYVREMGGEWYKGTADSIFQNINFIDRYSPEYVMILSGDHIYKMDYSLMLDFHKEKKADATISVIKVPWEEANRFGIMNTANDGSIVNFEEKPSVPKNNLASMGIYIFNWDILKTYLKEDAYAPKTSHDFGKNIIPAMLHSGQRMYAYPFKDYWKDVGTVESYWQANMDLLGDTPLLDLYDAKWPIASVNPTRPPHYIGSEAKISRSLISEGCWVFGHVEHSVLFPNVYVAPGAVVKDSVVMPYARIESGVSISKTIVGRKVTIKEGAVTANNNAAEDIAVIPEETTLEANTSFSRKSKQVG